MAKKVAIYTTPTCTYCRMTKEFFKENNVQYEEYNVGIDATRRQEMVDKSGQMGVPVIAVETNDGDEQIIVGFDKTALANALGV
jgi:glutaredoxin-like YruB-family protein